LQPQILQVKLQIESWGVQICNLDFEVESAAIFPPIVGICVRIQSGADGNNGNGDGGNGDDGNGDNVSDRTYSTKSTLTSRLAMCK